MLESERLADGMADRLVIDDRPQTTETLWQAVAGMQPSLLVVDHIRLLKDKHQSEDKRLGIITQNLKDIAKAFDIPVLALAQLNRAVEARMEPGPIWKSLARYSTADLNFLLPPFPEGSV